MVPFLKQQNPHQLSVQGSSHAFTYFTHFVGHDSNSALAALQKTPVQSYIMHPWVMEANADFGIGLGIWGPRGQPG